MTEEHTPDGIVTPVEPKKTKKKKGVLFLLVSTLALFVIPLVTVLAMVLMVLLQPRFYTGVLKSGNFITAFVEAKNWQTETQINEEIERDVKMSEFMAQFERIKARYEQAKDVYARQSRESEIESLKKQRKEVKKLKWKQAKAMFASEELFDVHRKSEIERINRQLDDIDQFVDKNSDAIKIAKKELKESQGEYEDAISTLEEKKEKVRSIHEKHKDTLGSKLYADMERVEKPLSKIVNNHLIDGSVRNQVEKTLAFFTSYDTQIARKNVFFDRELNPNAMGRRSLRVRLPEIEVSLWTQEGGRRKHVLSQLLVEELDKMYNLQNKGLLTTAFRLADSSMGEYFQGRVLSKYGASIDAGVVRIPAIVLDGETAEYAALAMQVMTWGQYGLIGAAALLALFIAFLFFSTVDRPRKLAALKRLFIVPSLLVLAACVALLWASQSIFANYPDLIEDITARVFVKHLSLVAAWYFIMPLTILFGSLLVVGLFMRKLQVRSEKRGK